MNLKAKQAAIALLLGVLGNFAGPFASVAVARDIAPIRPGVENETPPQVDGIGIDDKLGGTIDLDLTFRNERGETVPLRHYFKDGKPVLLSLAYYGCPSLCNFHLNGLTTAFKKLDAPLGEEFNFVVVSIDPNETSKLAAEKKESHLKVYARPEGRGGWHFLVGDEPEIKALAKSVGFNYRWDEATKQWAHASAAYVITPQGKISRYFYGIDFNPKVMRLSLVEASSGVVGTIVDKLILFCFHFDPIANKYTLYAINAMRAGAAFAVLVLAAFLLPFWLRGRREQRVQGEV